MNLSAHAWAPVFYSKSRTITSPLPRGMGSRFDGGTSSRPLDPPCHRWPRSPTEALPGRADDSYLLRPLAHRCQVDHELLFAVKI